MFVLINLFCLSASTGAAESRSPNRTDLTPKVHTQNSAKKEFSYQQQIETKMEKNGYDQDDPDERNRLVKKDQYTLRNRRVSGYMADLNQKSDPITQSAKSNTNDFPIRKSANEDIGSSHEDESASSSEVLDNYVIEIEKNIDLHPKEAIRKLASAAERSVYLDEGDLITSWESVEPIDEKQIRLNSANIKLLDKDFVALKNRDRKIVGLFEVEDANSKVLNLLTINSDRLPQKTDYLQKLSLESGVEDLPGTTYLWRYRGLTKDAVSYYKPLFTQGATIGDTAQTLYKGEFLATALGTLGYGLHRNITVSTNIPAMTLGSPNARIKGRFYSGVTQSWALGVSYAQSRRSSEKLVNLDIIWDSVLSENLVAHSILSAAVVSFDEARDIAALKSYGNSSIQTGYEYIFPDWSRMIMGPNYNVEQKAIGGYLGYLKIFDKFHMQISLSTTDVREMKLSADKGYLVLIDAYWRW